MCCNVRGTWCWEAITPLRQRRTKTHFMGTQTSASVIRSRFTLKNTQEWRWSALDLAKFIPPHPWLHYCHSNSAICIWDPFFLSSPPIKKKTTRRFFSASLKDPSRSDAASAPVHRHRASLIQSFLRRLHQDGETAVGHLALLHGAHQLHRKQSRCVRQQAEGAGLWKYPQFSASEPSEHLHIPEL